MPNQFSPNVIAKSIHDTLDQAVSAIPAGQDGALLIDGTITAGKPTAQVLIATRVGKDWTLAAGGGWDGHSVDGKVVIAGSWKWH